MIVNNYSIEVRPYKSFTDSLGENKYEKEEAVIEQVSEKVIEFVKSELEFEQDLTVIKDVEKHFYNLKELSKEFKGFMLIVSNEYNDDWGIISDGDVYFERPYDLLSGNHFRIEYY